MRLIAAIVLIICISVLTACGSGMDSAVGEYISSDRNGSNAKITDYKQADEDDLELLTELNDEKEVTEAIYDVAVSYTNEDGEDDDTYLDFVYKDSSGWHVAD